MASVAAAAAATRQRWRWSWLRPAPPPLGRKLMLAGLLAQSRLRPWGPVKNRLGRWPAPVAPCSAAQPER